MGRIAVIDFETNGLSPSASCRATEIAAVLVEEGRIVGRYQSLMNANVFVPREIERLTGISNAMLREAPPAARVMREVADFVGDTPLVAHNAAFDRKFWDHELALIGATRRQEFACSLLLARRLLPEAPDHKLGTLGRWLGLPVSGRAHRALADSEMTAHLLVRLQALLAERHGVRRTDHALLCALQKVPAARVADWLAQVR
ncbi:3'-5' exonuclease [Crenobacter caeni]|uniref:3'-5' exonuclease n=1 Tax=Crenobacter caeni TaxID=2705474 RepID=A0A6B2KSR9_9NEIS|nr:3'-5' exonuclease [Crenobacter caeni]NDV13154.1 3'-5' exonuclease [Crenobacter caeni]